jgi:hypothetical protein
MEKDETVWLIIRLVGLAFAADAVYSAMEFTENLLAVFMWSQPVAEGTLRKNRDRKNRDRFNLANKS